MQQLERYKNLISEASKTPENKHMNEWCKNMIHFIESEPDSDVVPSLFDCIRVKLKKRHNEFMRMILPSIIDKRRDLNNFGKLLWISSLRESNKETIKANSIERGFSEEIADYLSDVFAKVAKLPMGLLEFALNTCL